MQVIFTQHSDAAHPTPAGVYGVISLIFWAMTLIVSIKYAGLLMRVHNRGDGGGMALAALIQRRGIGRTALLVTLGIFGAGLFFGDGMITPAISVTSAVEGLKVVTPGLAHLVVPIALGILICSVPGPAEGNRCCGLAVRPADPRVVRGDRGAGRTPGGAAPRDLPGPLTDLGCALHGRSRRRRVPRARRGGTRPDGGGGALCRSRSLRRATDPAHMVRDRVPGRAPVIPGAGRVDPGPPALEVTIRSTCSSRRAC